jgi:hypothetical protein
MLVYELTGAHRGEEDVRRCGIVAMFSVEPKTVSTWRLRYPDFPEPNVVIGDMAGWDPDRAEEIRVWASRGAGRARAGSAAPNLRLQVHAPDDFAWVPIAFPGVEYDHDGRLADGMQTKAAAHLVDAIRSQGLEIAFEDPAANVIDVYSLRRGQVHPPEACCSWRRAPLYMNPKATAVGGGLFDANEIVSVG